MVIKAVWKFGLLNSMALVSAGYLGTPFRAIMPTCMFTRLPTPHNVSRLQNCVHWMQKTDVSEAAFLSCARTMGSIVRKCVSAALLLPTRQFGLPRQFLTITRLIFTFFIKAASVSGPCRRFNLVHYAYSSSESKHIAVIFASVGCEFLRLRFYFLEASHGLIQVSLGSS